MDVTRPYNSVSCDFVDHIEIMATLRKKVRISYLKNNSQHSVYDTVKTWYTDNKVEFLQTTTGLIIRLDDIVEIDGIVNSGSCNF